MTIFFVSDMHFGHKNIVTYCNRPWSTVEEMNEGLVSNWNDTVKAGDTVYHLGDWAFHDYHHIGRLNGFIHSIPGNHDRERDAKLLPYLPNGFTDEVVYLKIDKSIRFVLCHYPFETWRREYKYHLHGHTHGKAENEPGYDGYRGPARHRLDVGVDATRLYRPVALEEVLEILNGQIHKAGNS